MISCANLSDKMARLGPTVSMYQNLNPTNTNINEVAFSGSYTDLANTPVISAVGHNGQYSDVLNPPTHVSQFANDANYAVIGQKVSEFVNDANYAVIGQKVSEFADDASGRRLASLPTMQSILSMAVTLVSLRTFLIMQSEGRT